MPRFGVTLVLVFSFSCFVDSSKRLLVNDPDLLNNKLGQIEAELQRLTSEFSSYKQDVSTKMADLISKIALMEKGSNGAVYIRWGRKTCPANGTDLVYTGVAGGGQYSQVGATADYVCLPHDPDLITKEVSTNPWNYFGRMYGAEYEDNLFGANVFQNDVPCAVCHTQNTKSILMIPGRNHCYVGWKMEYNGKLASGHEGSKAASEYVCVDKNPEILERGAADENGKQFNAVRASCGSLPCPPYVNNAFLTCVVCSK